MDTSGQVGQKSYTQRSKRVKCLSNFQNIIAFRCTELNIESGNGDPKMNDTLIYLEEKDGNDYNEVHI